MKAVHTTIGDAEALIETTDDKVGIVGEQPRERKTKTTGVPEKLKASYENAKVLIREMAADMTRTLNTATDRPKKLELEFSLGLSAGANLWIFTGKGEGVLKVKMTWE